MAQHTSCYQPATEAVESSKKRRRCDDSRKARSYEQSQETKSDFDLGNIFRQAILLEPDVVTFPSIDWSFEEEDSIGTEEKILCLAVLGFPSVKQKNSLNTTIGVIDHKENLEEQSPLKKRKLISASESPQMVRSIALSSHLSDLARPLELPAFTLL